MTDNMEGIRKAIGAAGLAVAAIASMGAPAQAQDDATIKMGLVAFLSGPAAGHFGIPARNGAEMTIDAINNGTLPPPYDSKGFAGRQVVVVSIDE